MTDRNQAETMYPNQQGRWRIELRYLPIAHRGHAFLALVDPDGRPVRELHGLAHSQHSGERMVMGMDGAHLRAGDYSGSPIGGHKVTLATVGSGSKEEIDKIWEKGSAAARTITAGKFDYKAHDPSYEVGTDGGQIQNSNSVAFTLGKAMGLDLDRAIRDAGMSRRFSGWGRDLLDPKYERYVTPPTFFGEGCTVASWSACNHGLVACIPNARHVCIANWMRICGSSFNTVRRPWCFWRFQPALRRA